MPRSALTSPQPAHRARTRGACPQGFTLVEVLVALAVMALMALMSWRGVDAMLRAQQGLAQRADALRTLQSGLAQWQSDLNRLAAPPRSGLPAWDWDGRVLRLTREAAVPEDGLQVVAWSWRAQDAGAPWLRWQSPPLRTHSQWQAAWQNAQQWSQTPTAELRAFEVPIQTLGGWQIFVHLGGSWTNPLSNASTGSAGPSGTSASGTAGAAGAPSSATAPAGTVPDGVRLLLDLPANAPLPGRLTLDWVRPSFTGAAP